MKFASDADYYRFWAGEARRGGSPLYERLGLLLASDATLQALAGRCKKGQPPANILLGAVHYLLLKGAEHPLRDYYPSVGGARPAGDGAGGAFRDFCATHEAQLVPLIEAGVTNTNEVGRSALLAAGLSFVANEARQPLALIEIGPSAGLNLNFDRYALRFTNMAGDCLFERWGPSPLTIICEARGDRLPAIPPAPPAIASRLGLELNPVDLSNEDARLWLKALVWPERLDRIRKLEAALVIAADHPPPIRAGDALALLPAALAEVDATATPCVIHTMATYQFSDATRADLNALIELASHERPIWRVSVEMGAIGVYPLVAARYEKGNIEARELARCDSHGLWIEWLG